MYVQSVIPAKLWRRAGIGEPQVSAIFKRIN